MSKNWAKGSTRAWRKLRAYVLARDSYRCQIKLPGCTSAATHVHHTLGRAVTGDDPRYLQAACAHCNIKTGDPTKTADPRGRSATKW